MEITDWDAWMKEHHIYIPTEEEAKLAIVLGQKKVKAAEAYARKIDSVDSMIYAYEAYNKLVTDSR